MSTVVTTLTAPLQQIQSLVPPLPKPPTNAISVIYDNINAALAERNAYIEMIPLNAPLEGYCCICDPQYLDPTYEILSTSVAIDPDDDINAYGFALRSLQNNTLLAITVMQPMSGADMYDVADDLNMKFTEPKHYERWIEVLLVCTEPSVRLGFGTIILLYGLIYSYLLEFKHAYLRVANIERNPKAVEFYKKLFFIQPNIAEYPEKMILLDIRSLFMFDLSSLILRSR